MSQNLTEKDPERFNILLPVKDEKSMVVLNQGKTWNLITHEGVYRGIPKDVLKDFLMLQVDPDDLFFSSPIAYVEAKDFLGNLLLTKFTKSARQKIHKWIKNYAEEFVTW